MFAGSFVGILDLFSSVKTDVYRISALTYASETRIQLSLSGVTLLEFFLLAFIYDQNLFVACEKHNVIRLLENLIIYSSVFCAKYLLQDRESAK